MIITGLEQVNQFVLTKQHLTEDSKTDDILKIVEDGLGLHATAATTPYLSLLARTKDFTKKTLDEELYVKRELGKVRCMRRTVHVLHRATIPVALAATRQMAEVNSVNFLKTMGVTIEQYESLAGRILTLLKTRGMTAAGIKQALSSNLNISSVVNLMCDRGLLMRGEPQGGWKSNVHTYYLFEEYFPGLDLKMVDEEEARKLLVEKYMAVFGPVTETDIVWWTGLKKSDIRRALDGLKYQLSEVRVSGLEGDYLLFSSQTEALEKSMSENGPSVNLLPLLDPYLMGYKERRRYLEERFYEYIFDRAGNATSTIMVDGRIAGVWDISEEDGPVIKLFLFEKTSRDTLAKIYAKAAKTGRFITDSEVRLKECSGMKPFAQRTAGGFMTPLRDS